MDQTGEPRSSAATPEDRPMPPVEAPTGRFIMQLFLIPLLIVGIFGAGLYLFQRMMASGADPHQLALDIRRAGSDSWQKAYTLSNLLHSRQHAELKRDRELCGTLIATLEDALKDESGKDEAVQFRVFLCRSLGEFVLTDPVPVLLKALRRESGQDSRVRLAAVVALSVLAEQLKENGDENAFGDVRESIVPAMIAVTREAVDGQDPDGIRELQATAAYALGVVGGEPATERLVELLSAGYPNIRYNAATGLAWQGDERALPVLLEMLDPNNRALMEGELSGDGPRSPLTREEVLKSRQGLVMSSAIRAVTRLCRSGHLTDQSAVERALRKLSQAKVPRSVRIQAEEALILIKQTP